MSEQFSNPTCSGAPTLTNPPTDAKYTLTNDHMTVTGGVGGNNYEFIAAYKVNGNTLTITMEKYFVNGQEVGNIDKTPTVLTKIP